MKQKYHLISSIISMVLTAVLLICVCLAWYSSNKVANVNGMNGKIIGDDSLIKDVKYYKFSSKTVDSVNSKVRMDIESFAPFEDGMQMNDYDMLDATTPTELLIAIELTGPAALRDIVVKTSSDFIDDDLLAEGNSLASVLNFNVVYGEISGGVFSYDTTIQNKGSLVNIEKSGTIILGATMAKQKNLIPYAYYNVTEDNPFVYILIDWNIEAIEYIYSLNIGNPVLEEEKVGYVYDFSLTINT